MNGIMGARKIQWNMKTSMANPSAIGTAFPSSAPRIRAAPPEVEWAVQADRAVPHGTRNMSALFATARTAMATAPAAMP